jgi:hypothetical protein
MDLEFLPYLLANNTPFGEKTSYITDIKLTHTGWIYGTKAFVSQIEIGAYSVSQIAIFKNDHKDLFYVADLENKRYILKAGGKPEKITVNMDIPLDKIGSSIKAVTAYIMCHHKIQMKDAGEEYNFVRKETPRLFGPMDLDEILSQKGSNFAFLYY